MKKRIFALALALCMMLSAMPTSFAGNGFLTLDNGEREPSEPSGILTPGDPVLPEEDLSGEPHLTLDDPAEGSRPAPDDPIDEPHLTLDDPVDEPEDRPARQWRPAPFEEETFTQCDICGYLDGSHAGDCPVVNPPEEQAPAQSTIAEYKPAPMSAATYQDIYDSMMSAETLAEYKAELNALSADLQEAFFSLLTVEEREALSEREDSLAHDALTVTGAENATRTVTVEARASAFSFALHEALRQLGQDLIVSIYGRILESIDLPQNDYTMLETITPTDGARYQWQIQADDDLWVDIYNETGSIIRVSYAMVASLLDRYDAVQVRCEITGEDGVSFTDPVEVCVDNASEDVYIDAEEEPAEGDPIEDETVEDTVAEDGNEGEETAVAGTTPEDGETAEQPMAMTYAVRFLSVSANGEDTLMNDDDGIAPVSNEDVYTNYNIVIHYVFQDGTTAAPDWTATVATGSTYGANIDSPAVLGYKPDLETVQVSASAETTYTVTYRPAEVEYTVKHWMQNVSNDDYKLDDTETKTGYTESTVGSLLARSYEGFYSLLYDKETKIAADGSTEVNIYYDRYYYLMNFDLDGGYGVEPIYARYKTPINVGEPTKAGYTFQGWTLAGEEAQIPETMPAENRTYKAVWKADNTAKVTVVFWGENADDEEYSYIKSAQVNVEPGTKFTYSEDGSLICALEVHTHSIENNCYTLTCTQEVHTHSEACYTCGQESHIHTSSCYSNVESNPTAEPGGWGSFPSKPTHGQIYREERIIDSNEVSYIYLTDAWYKITSGHEPILTCALKEQIHIHTDDCLGCGKTEHTHSIENGCYTLTCDKPEHTHTSDCYMSGAGLDSNLWTFVRSDTVTVAADGSTVVNVYYDRTAFTLTFKDNNRTVATITEKWGADISDEFNKAPFNTTYNGRAWECTEESKYSYALQTLDRMPKFDATFTLYKKNSYTLKTIYYYVENVGANVSENTWPTSTSNFTLLKTVQTYFNYATYNEEYHEIEGFTRYSRQTAGFNGDNQKEFSNNTLYLYYLRNDYNLTFNDGYNNLKTESVQYQKILGAYSFTPDVPKAYEAGSVVFGGWYLNPECSGDEYVLNEHTMPLGNLILYAKWVPVSHTVEFYLDHAALNAGTKLSTHPDVTVRHGSKLNPTPAEPKNGSYTFIGWFYMENGVEKAFDFANMPVTKDLKVYGKWSSNTLMNYTIKYQLEDGTTIAPDTQGSAPAGTAKTFYAKTGSQLADGYQSGYYPKTSSHSMTLNIEDTAKNVYTFVYVAKAKVSYTVKYLEQGTDNQLAPPKTVETTTDVVTETFVSVTGYMPDAYQKRLVLAADNNEIIFWYTKDDVHAPVQIIHWMQNIVGDGYTEYQSSTNLNGIIGTEHNEEPLDIRGFRYNATKSNATGTLTAKGLVLNLYYDRIEYPYAFLFLEQGTETEKQLADPVTGNARYQAQVTQGAKTIPGYKLVSAESQAINIQIEDPADTANKNVKVFYYIENAVTINYQVEGPAGCGTLDNYSESVKAVNGQPNGSTPTTNEGFKFVGWFTDKDCTKKVAAEWVSDNKLTPPKTKNYGTEQNPVMGYEAATYYAKFEYNLTDLTITKEWAPEDNLCYKQDTIFIVKGEGLPEAGLRVVIPRNESSVTITGLTVGQTYTVTEDSGWSWRYTATSDHENGRITLVADKDANLIEFTNKLDRDNGKIYWLDDSDHKKNKFGVPNGN